MNKLLIFCLGLLVACAAFALSCWLLRAIFGWPWFTAAVALLAAEWAVERAGRFVRVFAL